MQGKRSCQALETNLGSRAQKLSFPGSCLPNFRLATLQALVRAVMLQRTLTRNARTALVAWVHGYSTELQQLGIVFSQALHVYQASTSMRTTQL